MPLIQERQPQVYNGVTSTSYSSPVEALRVPFVSALVLMPLSPHSIGGRCRRLGLMIPHLAVSLYGTLGE